MRAACCRPPLPSLSARVARRRRWLIRSDSSRPEVIALACAAPERRKAHVDSLGSNSPPSRQGPGSQSGGPKPPDASVVIHLGTSDPRMMGGMTGSKGSTSRGTGKKELLPKAVSPGSSRAIPSPEGKHSVPTGDELVAEDFGGRSVELRPLSGPGLSLPATPSDRKSSTARERALAQALADKALLAPAEEILSQHEIDVRGPAVVYRLGDALRACQEAMILDPSPANEARETAAAARLELASAVVERSQDLRVELRPGTHMEVEGILPLLADDGELYVQVRPPSDPLAISVEADLAALRRTAVEQGVHTRLGSDRCRRIEDGTEEGAEVVALPRQVLSLAPAPRCCCTIL